MLYVVKEGLFDIFKRVVKDVADDRVSTESFHLFAFPWEMAIGAIRHRELTLSKEPVKAKVSRKRTAKKKTKKKEECADRICGSGVQCTPCGSGFPRARE